MQVKSVASESIFDIKFDNFLHFYPSIITIVRAVESEAGGHCRTGVTGWENIWLWRVWVGQRRASIIIVEDCVVQQLTKIFQCKGESKYLKASHCAVVVNFVWRARGLEELKQCIWVVMRKIRISSGENVRVVIVVVIAIHCHPGQYLLDTIWS